MKKKIIAKFFGQVQGVGFRYTAKSLADELGLVGFVKNINDDTVELVALGKEKNLKNFLKKVQENFNNNIKDVKYSWSKPSETYQNFKIEI